MNLYLEFLDFVVGLISYTKGFPDMTFYGFVSVVFLPHFYTQYMGRKCQLPIAFFIR
jgi:hypothetical protein